MKQIVSVPISPFQHNVIDEVLINVPETQLTVIQAFYRGMRFIKYNSLVVHIVYI